MTEGTGKAEGFRVVMERATPVTQEKMKSSYQLRYKNVKVS